MSIFKIFSEETQSLWKFYFVFIKSFAVFEIFDELSILWSIECLMDKIWPFLSTSVRRQKLKKGDFHKILNFKRQVALLICPRHESSYLVHSIARGIFLSETESRTEMKTQTIAIENHTKLIRLIWQKQFFYYPRWFWLSKRLATLLKNLNVI